MKLVILISLFFTFQFSFAEKSSENAVKFLIVESWPEPYAFFDQERSLTGGALREIIEEISKRMGVRAEYVYFSRNRADAAIEKGSAEVRCYINEAWATKPDLYLFTQPIFLTTNSVIWKKGRTPLTKMSDLHGKTIGTVSGYIYKTVDDLFKSGKAKRSDLNNEGMNITLLMKDRINYAIVETASFKSSMTKKNDHILKDIEFFQIDSIPVKCGVLKKNMGLFKLVDSAIEKMKQDGTIKTIATKYNLKY